jgi:hypothetical protein
MERISLAEALRELDAAQRHVRDAENIRGSLVRRILTLEEKLEVCTTGEGRRLVREELEKAKDELADAAHAVTVAKQAERTARGQVEAAEAWPKQRRFQIDELRRFLRSCENGRWAAEERVRVARRDLADAEQAGQGLLREHDSIAARLAALEAEEREEAALLPAA